MSDRCIRIEPLENGYEVSVPDMAEIAKREAAAKKDKSGGVGATPYMGDCVKEYAAMTATEVIKIVKTALETMVPGSEYEMAFEEAGSK